MIFSEKNNELTLFGKTLTDVQSKLSKYTMPNVKEQLTPDEQLTKILSDSEASDIVNNLNSIKDQTNDTYTSFDSYFKKLDEKGKGYIADYVKENQNQIYVTEDVIEASERARQKQIAHNEVVQQSTLAFKASKVAMQGLAMAGNMIAMWAITEVVGLAVNKFDELHVTVEESRESLENLKQEYSDIESQMQSLNDELSSTQQRIQELEAKGSLSLTEQEEYDNLVKTNNELQRQVNLLELEKKIKNKEKNKTFVETMSKELGDLHADNSTVTTRIGEANDWLEERKRLNEELSAAKSKEEKSIIQSQIDDVDQKLFDYSKQWGTNAEGIEYISTPSSSDEEAVNQWLDFIYNFQDEMAIAMGGDDAKQNAFNRLVDNWNFDDTLQNLQDLGEQGSVTGDMLDNSNYDEFIQTLHNLGVIKNTSDLDDVAKFFNNMTSSVESATQKTNSFIDAQSKIESLSSGYEQLSSIYSDIKDAGNFDWSSILNNQNFTETFGKFEEEYNNFIQTVANSPDDIAACQNAFDKLATTYLNNSDALNNLTEDTKASSIAMLEQMGISNAQEIVDNKLAAQQLLLKINTNGTTDSIYNQIQGLLNEGTASGFAYSALFELVAEQEIFSNQSLNTVDKIKELEKLAKAYGITADSAVTSAELEAEITFARRMGATPEQIAELENKALSGNQTKYQKAIEAKFGSISANYKAPTNVSKNTSSAVQETKETFNWIETALSRIQQKVTHFGKTVAATWQSWKVRNAALKDQMSAIRNEISLQDQAYIKYTNLANSVGLSEGYKRLVENGSINIETIESESIAEAIKLYQEYYEKALAAKDASADLKDELAALAQTKFSNLAQSFADLMSGNEHTISMYEATIELMEKRGYTASASLYDSLKEAESKNQDILKEKYQSLSQALDEAVSSGAVVKYSEQWYQMQNEILAVEEAIIQSNIALAEYDNTLRDLEWNAFDKLHEEISEIYEETEFLDKLLSDEKKFNEDGSMTDAGQAALGLGVVNYKTHLAQAEEYAQELERIRAELANDPYNQTLLDREDELEEKLRGSLTAVEDDEQSMIDTVSEGYDTLLDYMDQMIDKRKNMLSQAKDLYEYEKNISKQTQEIASLEKQLIAYQGDDSEEARATIQKLQVSLSEAKDNLEETEYDKYISDQEEMLDTLRLQTEEWINTRLDNEDQLLKDIVSSTEKNATMINDTLNQVVSSTGTTLSEAMKTIWSNDGDIGKAITEIKTYLAGMQKNSEEKAKEQVQNNTPATSNSGTTPTTAPAPTSTTPATTSASTWGDFFIKKSDSYPKNKLNTETSIVDRLKYSNFDSSFSARSQYYTAMGGSGVYTGSSSQNRWMIAQMKAHSGFARGGFIGDMIRAAGEDGIALVRRGEGIIPTNMVPEWNALIHHLPQINHSMLGPIGQHSQKEVMNIGDINVSFELPNVQNYSEFMAQMQNDRNFERMIQDMTLGVALGGHSMKKYQYKW